MMRTLLLIACLAGVSGAHAQIKLTPIDIRVPEVPTAAWSGSKSHYVYELRVTNLGRRDLGLQQVDVSVGGKVAASWTGDSLKAISVAVGGGPDGRRLPSGKQTLLYLLVSTDQPAPSLDHQFLFTHADSIGGPARDTVAGFRVTPATQPAVAITAPLRGGPWLAANGPGNTSGHRRTVIPLDGVGRIAQRFATDWVKFGPDGTLWRAGSTKNEDWYGYGEPIVAVGPGTVVATKDGIPENVPLSPNRAVPITLETVGGNYVIVDLGGGRYAFYAHLIPGSVKVKVGDKVKVGAVVGLLGNSGNSDAPHLHFHVGDVPSPLGTEGIPFALDQYWMLGQGQEFIQVWKASGPESVERNAIPLENQVVRFKP